MFAFIFEFTFDYYISCSCCFLHVSLVSGFTGHHLIASHERRKKGEERREKKEGRRKKGEERREKNEGRRMKGEE
jgi:hypothetical protein